MSGNYYESDRALSEYLLFHYGRVNEGLPPGLLSMGASNFPVRVLAECLDVRTLSLHARAIDLGCAVGRAAFELARNCADVVGIDYSQRFITIADHLKQNGSFLFGCVDEGDLTHPSQAVVPTEIDRTRVNFQRGDAMNLPNDLGTFDAVLMANLIDRLTEPCRCLSRLPGLLNPGGQLIITSPYTWLPEYTAKANWLGGFEESGRRVQTLATLKQILEPDFNFAFNKDVPFLIREHARKYQLSVAEASVWIRK